MREETNDVTDTKADGEEISEDDANGNETDNFSTTDTTTPSLTSTTKRVGAIRNGTGSDGWKNMSMRAIVPAHSSYPIMDVNGLKAFLDTIDMVN